MIEIFDSTTNLHILKQNADIILEMPYRDKFHFTALLFTDKKHIDVSDRQQYYAILIRHEQDIEIEENIKVNITEILYIDGNMTTTVTLSEAKHTLYFLEERLFGNKDYQLKTRQF